jgi:GH25 family lysozyme M1 (1,4-beta-N-acetylmuramidase)
MGVNYYSDGLDLMSGSGEPMGPLQVESTEKGLDVSHHNTDDYGAINWSQVYGAGNRFAFTKATEGTSFTDATFRTNMANAKSAQMLIGVYHFARPDVNSNAVAEANYFVSVTGSYFTSGYLRPVLDLETGSSIGWNTLSSWADTWMSTVKSATGVEPILYVNSNYANNLSSSLTKYQLWVAHYYVTAPNTGRWPTWNFWQYTDIGSTPGVGDPTIDLDYFNGTLESLQGGFLQGCSNNPSSYLNILNGPPLHPNGTLVKEASPQAAWLLQDGQKRAIASEYVLRNLYPNGGFDFSDVITVSSEELALYPRGADILDGMVPLQGNGKSKPDGRLIRDASTGGISIITDSGLRRGFSSLEELRGLGYADCKYSNDSQYYTYPEGPPVGAMLIVTSSLKLSPAGPYFTGNTVSGSFTITNVGRLSATLNHLLIGGRLNGAVSDFDTDRPTTLSPGQAFTYTGTKNLSLAGNYSFFVAYQDSGGHWTTYTPANAGVSTSTTISVGSPTNYTVAVSASPSGAGSVGGGGTFAAGSSVTVTASANSGYTFANWTENGIAVSSSASYAFTVSGNRTLVANFTANQVNYTLTLSASPSIGGTVSGGGTFTAGSSRTVTATVNSGYTFANWTENGSVVSSSINYTFTLNSNRTLVANFSANPVNYTITLSPSPAAGGTASGGGTFAAGSSRTVTATANSGYAFVSWTENGGVVSSSASYSFTLNANRTLVANFTPVVVNVSVAVQTNPSGRSFTVDGTTYTSAQTFTWASGSGHTVSTTSPQSGGVGTRYLWSSWSDGGAISHSVAPTAGAVYTANFTAESCTYSLSSASQPFTANGGSGSVGVVAASACAWTANANANWISVTGGGTGNGSGTVSYSVAANTTTAQRTGTMTVAGQTFTVTQDAAGGCTVTPISVGQTVNGALNSTDCLLSDGSFYDLYTFNGTAGQQISISMSAGFDTYLFLLTPDGSVLASDDDGGGGTNSRIPTTSGFIALPVSGTYSIAANSFGAGVTGPYTLTLAGATPSAVVQFSSPSITVSEASTSAPITIVRSGNTTSTVSVTARTIDNPAAVRCDDTTTLPGTAFPRCDYATTVETLTFAPGETQKTISVPLINDSFVEPNENVQLALSNPTNASLGAQGTMTLTIISDDAPGAANPIFGTDFFVRMQYLDFLSRESEAGQPWSGVINNCAAGDTSCDRISVSANFFRSQEFQLKGLFVFRFYKVSFGRLPLYSEVVVDMRSVTGTTTAEVQAKKAAFTSAWMQRQEFLNAYSALSNQQFVDALMGRYGLQQMTTPDPSAPDGTLKLTLTRADLVNRLTATTLTRGQVVRAIADSDQVGAAEFNPAFVAMQYFGYLRRDPDTSGYNAWLATINANPSDFRSMVNGFMNSTEYRLRFGQP